MQMADWLIACVHAVVAAVPPAGASCARRTASMRLPATLTCGAIRLCVVLVPLSVALPAEPASRTDEMRQLWGKEEGEIEVDHPSGVGHVWVHSRPGGYPIHDTLLLFAPNHR